MSALRSAGKFPFPQDSKSSDLIKPTTKKLGERMGRYALAKRQAVVQEDFITAKLRKEQIEMYKKAVFAHLRVEALMERDQVWPIRPGSK